MVKTRSMQVRTEGVSGTLTVGDADFSNAVRAFTVRYEVGCLPTVELDMVIVDLDLEGDKHRVFVPDATREALIALGWTPPEE